MKMVQEKIQVIALADDLEEMSKTCLHDMLGKDKHIFVTTSPAFKQSIHNNILLAWTDTVNLNEQLIEYCKGHNSTHDKFLFLKRNITADIFASYLHLMKIRSSDRYYVLDDADKRIAKNVIRRLFLGLISKDSKAILNAEINSDYLHVISTSFHRLNIPLEGLSKLLKTSRKKLMRFEVDEDGSYIYWSEADAHMGWEQFDQFINPEAMDKACKKSKTFNERYGKAIKHFRVKRGLRQVDISGLTERQVSRIENGKCRATSTAISKLAKAHKMPANEYMSKLADLLG
jgi:hypothetical protein